MSRQEQNALLAFFNSFKLARRATTFESLSDGKALLEVMNSIDATHFKNPTARGPSSTASTSSENWVLKMNTLKRLYRLLLSFELPPPHPANLSLSTLPEPSFNAVARSPSSSDGKAGLLQICRFCLAVAVWAPGNEKVIHKIQALEEASMAELMKSIEGVMATIPQEATEEEISLDQTMEQDIPPSSDLLSERDKLLQENDELRKRCEQMIEQVSDLTFNLDESRTERDDALARLTSARESSASAGLRASQNAQSEVERLRSDLARAEEGLAATEADLDKQTTVVTDLMKMVEDLKAKAAEAGKLKDQLDEYRHTAEKLQKSENVIEKYKKKLEESTGLRRELRSMEEQNSVLVNANATLEDDLRKAGTSRNLVDGYMSQISALEKKDMENAKQMTEMSLQLEETKAQLAAVEREHERDKQELQLHQEKIREIEMAGLPRAGSTTSVLGLKTTLDDELDGQGEDKETRTDLKLRLRALERELEEVKSASDESLQMSALKALLDDANTTKDRYQRDYLEAHRNGLKLQANLEQIRSGRGGDTSQTTTALRQKLNEVSEERDSLLKDKQVLEITNEEVERALAAAKSDLNLVGKDQRHMISTIRESVKNETAELQQDLATMRDQVAELKDKERMNLQEITRLLVDKIDLQSAGINQREMALERERQFGDLKASLAAKGVPEEASQQIVNLHATNTQLVEEMRDLEDKLQKARAFIRNQDALFKAEHERSAEFQFEEAQRSYESQIGNLKADLLHARESMAALENRYKIEQQLMLSAWHELGSRTVRDHIGHSGVRRSAVKPTPTSWLGRQRKHQEDASLQPAPLSTFG